MEFYDDLMAVISEAEQAWESTLTASEKALFGNVLELVKQLDIKGGDIVVSVKNLKTLNKIKKGLDGALLTDKYLSNISSFVSFYSVTDKVQNKYFSSLEKNFTPPEITNQIRQQAIDETIESLAGSGVKFEVLQPVRELISTNVTTGGNWAEMVKALDNIITSKLPDEGRLRKYTTQIVTDAMNQYSANYSQTITEDLGLKWFQYVGAKVTATRPLCNALVNQRYVHQSELPKIVKGVVKGRQTALGKNGLPLGQIPGTNATNFQTYRGGFNCSHHLIPVSEISVPKYLVELFKDK